MFMAYCTLMALVVLYGLWRTQSAATEIHQQGDLIEAQQRMITGMLADAKESCEQRKASRALVSRVINNDPDTAPADLLAAQEVLKPITCPPENVGSNP